MNHPSDEWNGTVGLRVTIPGSASPVRFSALSRFNENFEFPHRYGRCGSFSTTGKFPLDQVVPQDESGSRHLTFPDTCIMRGITL